VVFDNLPEGIKEITEPWFKYYEECGIPKPVEWLIPKYIPSTGIAILAGNTGSGKSFVSEEIISAIVNQRKVFGELEINGGGRPVILIDMENDHSILYERLQKLGGIPEKSLLVFNMEEAFSVEAPDELLNFIDELKPCLVIMDTLRRTYSGDENDSKVINEIYKTTLKPIAKDCCCLILAHNRKVGASNKSGGGSDDLSDIRGTGDITGIATAVLMLRKNIDNTITIMPKKLRPAVLAEPFTVKIEDTGDKFIFRHLGTSENLGALMIGLSDRLLVWLKANVESMALVKTKEMKAAMKGEDASNRSTQDAINVLIGRGLLKRERVGVYRFMFGNATVGVFTK
ncbi:MAG: AAA family ATPase, partial [Candidatus Aenigmatarchaeota archaeon]